MQTIEIFALPHAIVLSLIGDLRMSKIRIVHLSDIHFGQENKDGSYEVQEDIRDGLKLDCERMRASFGNADAIIVTGDIAFSGLKDEYDRAGDWLDILCDAVHCERRAVQTIPGNHDIDRKKIDYAVELIHRDLRACQADDVDGLLLKIVGNDPTKLTPSAEAFFGKLDAYGEFAERYESSFQSERKPVCVKEIRFQTGHVLRFLGLTSVQVSDGDDYPRKMVLGNNQYVFREEANVEYIIMCHHPFTWFKDESLALSRLKHRGRIMLAGHEHQPSFKKVSEGGNEYLMLDAGATNPPGSEKRSPHCYNWVEFELLENDQTFSLSVSVHPRIWIHELAAFGADQNRINGATSETYTVACKNYRPIVTALVSPAPIVSKVPVAVNEEEPATMPDEERFAKLLYFFWRYLDWRQRYGVLVEVEILPQGLEKPIPQLLERDALASARQQNKLSAVWDAVMQHVPVAQRELNPFNNGEN